MSRLPRSFFARPVLEVAPELLGAQIRSGPVSIRLTEVEAYAGTSDPASHAFRGPTPRTQVMFGPAGFLYVYFTYGMHWCANLVCESDGVAGAVLLRGGEVVAGHEVARSRRAAAKVDRDLARGPARLAEALGLTGADSGADLCGRGAGLTVHSGASGLVRQGPRVGISVATGWPWRFWLDGEPTVSAYRPGGTRSRARSAIRQTGARD
ncbi:MAG TPA: DNA-3-methyladenine glycosylase [Mycobacteriales bacterium]|nr:DNA-3-methyladenine glycosylase [Mycobacteriales bacterium]